VTGASVAGAVAIDAAGGAEASLVATGALVAPACGTTSAPDVFGLSRSGGTSSGCSWTLALYSSFS